MHHLGGLLFATLAEAQDFTLIALPDTQFYTCTDESQCAGDLGIYESQTAWIAANRDTLGIAFVTGLGDCVQNANQEEQFEVADAAFQILENAVGAGYPDGIPFGVAVGNHDQFPVSSPGSIPSVLDILHPDQGETTVLFNEYFGVERFCPASVCRSYYGDHFGINNDNHYDLFSAGDYDFVIVHLEYMPSDAPLRQAVIAWASEVLTRYSDRRAIVVSHHVVERGNNASFSNQGLAMYEGLKHHPNLFLLLGGHVPGEGRRTDRFQGRVVHSLLSDYQSRDDGGGGWLRILEFRPALDTLSVRTYSPWLDEFETDADSQFELEVDLEGGQPDPHASFQQGADGYGGASDTWIRSNTGAHGTDTTLTWGGTDGAALLRFGQLFDTEGGPIPQGAAITKAVLHIVLDDTGSDAAVHRVLAPWTDAVDHASFGATPGAQAGTDYEATPIAQVSGTARVQAIDVTASVAAWSADPSLNRGWIFVPSGSSAASLRSSDYALDVRDRPRLSITYANDGAGGPSRSVLLTDIDAVFVSDASPNTRFAGAEVDTSPDFEHTLLKPASLGDIAPGALVVRADLVMRVVDTGSEVQVREVLGDWSESTVTWNNAPAASAPLATFPGSAGEVRVDVTALVQAWVDGAPLNGINLYPTGGNGVVFDEIRFEIEVIEDGSNPCADADGDGHLDSSCGGDDCDDSASDIYPGAPEVCDGLDHDCSGAPDSACGQRTVRLTDLQDAYVSSANPNTNLGSATSLEVDTAGTFKQAFLKPASLGDIAPGALVLQATLVLRVFGAGNEVQVREVLGDWSESAVTWNNAPATGAPLATFPGSTGEARVDVTALVQAWVDGAPLYGVSLYPTGSNGVDLRSAEYADSALRPYLLIEIIEDGSNPCADADGDGHTDSSCGGDDCDDSAPDIYPGAPEVCGDGIDHDCSGNADCPSVQRTVRLTDLEDAFIADANPNTTFGSSAALEVDTAGTFKQAFLKPASLGDIAPGALVLQATLVLRVFGAGNEVQVREVLGDWSESAVTWNNAPATGAPLATFPGSTGEARVDVTALVQAWVDGAPLYGVSLYPTGSNGVDLRSAEYADSALRPYLLVEVLE